MPTDIQWTDETWNCVRGCSRVSSGCGDSTGGGCYAERQAYRFSGPGMPYEGLVRMTTKGPRWTGKVILVDEKLNQPLHWKTPRRIFVNSMSDLFHESLSDESIDRIFAVMALAPQHAFQILTKRPERMWQWFATKDSPLDSSRADIVMERAAHAGQIVWDARGNNPALYLNASKADVSNRRVFPGWPLPHVHLGTSVEDQKTADERIPLLLQTPAAVRWISAEPLLGPVDLSLWIGTYDCMGCGYRGFDAHPVTKAEAVDGDEKCPSCGAVLEFGMAENSPNLTSLDWVVVGGESGPKARPMHPDWARSLRDQCVAAGVPYFFKQWGEWKECGHDEDGPYIEEIEYPSELAEAYEPLIDGFLSADGHFVKKPKHFTPDVHYRALERLGKKAAGRLLDGREWNEFPVTANR